MVTTGMIKRAEMRKHLRIQQQLKVGTLALVAMLLLAAYPVYLFTRPWPRTRSSPRWTSSSLPEWAGVRVQDAASGSRWCIDECRFRDRTWASERAPEETSDGLLDRADRRRLAAADRGLLPAGGRGRDDLLAAGRVRDGHVGRGRRSATSRRPGRPSRAPVRRAAPTAQAAPADAGLPRFSGHNARLQRHRLPHRNRKSWWRRARLIRL